MDWGDYLRRLDEVLRKLEDGGLPLDGALEAFEKGVVLLREGRAFLESAEQRVTLLTQGGEEVPFLKDAEG